MLKLILASAIGLTLTACGKPKAARSSLSAVQHKVEECPALPGKYQTNGGAQAKAVTMTAQKSIVTLEDSGIKWTVDGRSHAAEGAPNLTYVGSCAQSKLSLQFLQNGKILGSMIYSKNEKGQMVIDSRLTTTQGKSQVDTWDPK